MDTSRVTVTLDWMYKEVKIYWNYTEYKEKLPTRDRPVVLLYFGAILLTNIRTCMYGKIIKKPFLPCAFRE